MQSLVPKVLLPENCGFRDRQSGSLMGAEDYF